MCADSSPVLKAAWVKGCLSSPLMRFSCSAPACHGTPSVFFVLFLNIKCHQCQASGHAWQLIMAVDSARHCPGIIGFQGREWGDGGSPETTFRTVRFQGLSPCLHPPGLI